ncbi:MAG: cupin domain-containing protein [Bryobacterales bacterium]|nr:cupin domain-containing protein [Bryobacterales bacterium]
MRRRDLKSLLLGVAVAGAATAQPSALPSKTFPFEGLPVRNNGRNRSRAVLNGKTRSGYAIEMHHTELAPGLAPHPPHQHVHEEVLVVREGTLEVTIRDTVTTLGPGGIAYIASNEHHGWKNIGATQAHYLVMTLGREG